MDIPTFLVDNYLSILTIATAWIGYQQYQLKKKMGEPNIIANLEYVGCGNPLVLLTLTNVGQGIAYNISAAWNVISSTDNKSTKSFNAILIKEEKKRFILKHIEELANEKGILMIHIVFYSESGKKFSKSQSIDLKKTLESIKCANQVYETHPLNQLLTQINTTLNDIKNAMKKEK